MPGCGRSSTRWRVIAASFSASISAAAWCSTAGVSSRPASTRPGNTPCSFTFTESPPAQSVVDRWGGEIYLWHRMLAQQGYIVLSIDNRGTPAPRGRAWRKCVYRQVGILAPREQAEALKALRTTLAVHRPPASGHLGLERRGLDDARLHLPLSRALPDRNCHRLRRGSALLRYDLPGAVHGSARRESRGLQARARPSPMPAV